MNENIKKTRTVVHVEFSGQHYYFGSVSAIYDLFSPSEIGVAYGTLRNYRVSNSHPYCNDKCIIRKGYLLTKEKETE